MRARTATFLRVGGLLVAGALVLAPTAASAVTVEYTPLAPSDPSANQRFGFSVAESSDGQTTVVGSIDRTVGGVVVPSVAYVYVGVTGSTLLTTTQTAQLVRTDTVGMSGSDQFGASVDVSANGNTIVVGAPGYATGGGAVYVFDRSGSTSWTQSSRIDPPATASLQFGQSVALSDDGTKLLVGAPGVSTSAQGTATYYVRASGVWTAKTTVSGGAAFARGGSAVALSPDGLTAAIGVPQYKATSTSSYTPRVNTYTYNGTTLVSRGSITDTYTTASSGTTGSGFGGGALSFTAAGTSLLVGAPYAATVNGTAVGGAGYLFATATSTTWARSATFLRAATPSARVGAAGAISPDGQRVALGAPYYSGGGQTLLWQKSGGVWGSSSPVGAGPNNTNAEIGYSVAFGASSRLVIGGIFQTYQSLNTGAAYLLDLS